MSGWLHGRVGLSSMCAGLFFHAVAAAFQSFVTPSRIALGLVPGGKCEGGSEPEHVVRASRANSGRRSPFVHAA